MTSASLYSKGVSTTFVVVHYYNTISLITSNNLLSTTYAEFRYTPHATGDEEEEEVPFRKACGFGMAAMHNHRS